ncbi:hypothetical protein Ctob_012439 [Chrysochromulina tobinii]|jgi:hypothetical protein|uniref:Uncharacterized protein n=1 Tax=Chrysochromulina tobinii TaxID=1460289 RepID=A0A0M0KDG4_9EUKA|nr:hypothetical protein Ctob_012439 [Chrysochromulina tobinii]|eukprot:KOO36622.1 hypothetical protein Ctob_012439 [Chrysochromulina sp. CCMP291]
MSAPRYYTGTFCTGHVPMVGSTAIQFEENAKKEFVEEYKKCHNMKRKKGPGLGYVYDFTAQPQRPSPAVPVAGCALARLTTGMFPERQAPTSSKAIGSWWTDPVFQEMKNHASTKGKGKPPDCLRGPLRSTTSEIGSYWHDPELDERDPYMDKLRAENGAKRVLPVESNSSFALEDLPTADRLL